MSGVARSHLRALPVVALSALASLAVMCGTAAASSVSFTTQGEHTFMVPSGVTSLTNVVAIGGAGGNGGGSAGGTGGHGAKVTVPTLTVIPGETLYIEVGANGRHGTIAEGGAGGSSANGGTGGSGGTASGICAASGCPGTSPVVLMMAGAGGGGGSSAGGSGVDDGTGGNGGNAGSAASGTGATGGNGGVGTATGSELIAAHGGGGGSNATAGDGGSPGGLNTSGLCGGSDPNFGGGTGGAVTGGNGGTGFGSTQATTADPGNGGGGGGGYHGGGGGGGGGEAICGDGTHEGGGAGGGGGGSFPAADATVDTAGDAAVVSFSYTPGPSTGATVAVTTAQPTLQVGGYTMDATVTVNDVGGHGVPGDAVTLVSSDPNVGIGAIRDNHDGTYTALITSSQKAETVTLTATDSSTLTPITGQGTYVQTAGSASAIQLSLNPATVTADGTSTTTATGTVVDQYGNTVGIGGDTVTFASTDPGDVIGTVHDQGNGLYTATITASTVTGTATITVDDTSQGLKDTKTLTEAPGRATAIGVALSKAQIPADGSSTTTAVATLTDALGNGIPGAQIVFKSSDPGQTISSVTSHGNGAYFVTITASHKAGTATITATDPATGVSGSTVLTSTGTGPSGGSGDLIEAVSISPKSVRRGKHVTLKATLKAASAVTIEVQRHIPAHGKRKHRHKAHWADVYGTTRSGASGANSWRLATTRRGHKLPAGRYRVEVKAGGRFHNVGFTIKR